MKADANAADLLQFSRQQPPWHVVVLSIFTLSIYNIYWFYRCLTQLNEEAAAAGANNISADPTAAIAAVAAGAQALQAGERGATTPATEASADVPANFCRRHPYFSTLLFLIPPLNLVVGMIFFSLVGELLPDQDSLWHRKSMLCGFGLALVFGALCLFSLLPEPYHLLWLLSALPLSLVQGGLNKHWQKTEPGGMLVRTAFNPIELVLIFFGAGLIGLILVGPSIIPAGR